VLKNKIFLTSAGIAVFVSLIHILFCVDVYDDISNYYGPITTAFGRSDWAMAFCPKVPVFNTTLAGLLVKCGMHPFSALVTVSCVFYCLGIPFVYLFAKAFLKRSDFAAMTCLLYVLAPKIIRYSCTGLLNSSRNTLALAAVVILLYFRKKPAWWKTLALGAATAFLALARGEAIVFAPLFGLWLGYLIFEQNKFKFNRKFIGTLVGHWIVLLGMFVICVSPRMVQMYHDTGAPVLDIRQAYHINKVLGREVERQPDQIILPLEGIKHPVRQPLTDIIIQGVDCFVNGAYIPYLLLAILGIIVLARKKELRRTEPLLLLSVIIFNAATFILLVNSVRYYTINLLMLLPFTFIGLRFIWDFLISTKYSRQLKIAGLLILAGVAIAQIINGMAKVIKTKNRYEYNSGVYILNEAKKLKLSSGRDLKVASPKSQYAFWSNATWVNMGRNSEETIVLNKAWLKQNADFILVNRKSQIEVDTVESIGFVKLPKQPSKKLLIYRKGG
jgi:hypothetical protein